MDGAQINRILARYKLLYPPIIDFQQAAEIAHAKIGMIYDYSSRKLFDNFRVKVGKKVLLDLEGFVTFILTRDSQLELCMQVPEQAENSAAPEPAPHVNSTFNHEVD